MKKLFIPYGSDTSSGEYMCVDCGYVFTKQSNKSLPVCPMSNLSSDVIPHVRNGWISLSGQGDAPEDPYPDEK
ncbi:hypothetical protein I3B46_13260 [Providencia sp. 2.29]|uniref:hypothetical protein n=2 Tax=Morganellaceae TaxID=1903414 RepID=UPI0018CB2AFB|nr:MULTISPECIES: hypothetical protein [Providencia]MBS7783825.1 hypothetical protein [Providencia thailandensis]QPN39119.1 hypothetical protein I3B46_13260 [Providencia sp. 2.29]